MLPNIHLRQTLVAFSAAACLALAPAIAHAQAFTLAFSPATQSVLPGMSVTYSAFITNTTSSDLYINSDAIDPLGSGLSADDAPFYNTFGGTPVLLGANQTYALTDLFTVTDTTAPLGAYSGQYTIYGGTDPLATDMSGFQTFSVNVRQAPVPEASSLASFAVLLAAGVAAWAVKRRKTAAAL